MTLLSIKDRPACIAAMLALWNHMNGLPGFSNGKEQTPEEVREEVERVWDHDLNDAMKECMLGMWQSLCIPEAYYECHLTFDMSTMGFDMSRWDAKREEIVTIGEKYHFRFSEIEGDEVFGRGKKQYLTRSLKDGPTLANDMNALTFALMQAGIPILRRKIEHIVFDERRDKIAGTGRAA